MWKNHAKKLKKISFDKIGYSNYFLESFPKHCQLLAKEVLLKKLNEKRYDLFYQQMNLEEMFYNGDISEIISIYYHYNEINWYENGINLSSYDFYKELSFLDFERLLSRNDDRITISFLFLFFIPNNNLKNFLFNSIKKISLVSCANITLKNFKMLIYLMSNFDNNNFKKGCDGYNYNHQLIEDYTKTNDKEIPLAKIFILLGFNCGFKALEDLRRLKNLINLSTLYKYLVDIEINFRADKLSKKLKHKVKAVNYLIKI